VAVFCGVDPGTNKSGFVLFDNVDDKIIFSSELENEIVRSILRVEGDFPRIPDVETWEAFFIEDIESMGLVVGKSTFQTVKWIGRFVEAYEYSTRKKSIEILRGDEKITLCGARTFVNPKTGSRKAVTDANIKSAVIDRFLPLGGGKIPQVGTKKEPGPLYGVKGHCWQALAVLITGLENLKK
jgi:hypothetical protein